MNCDVYVNFILLPSHIMKHLIKHGKNHKFPQIVAILIGSFSGIGNGLLYAWSSPSIPELVADIDRNITLDEVSYFTVITPLAMMVSGPLVSIILEVLGRRATVLFVSVCQLLAWITVWLAESVWMFYISRVFAGIGDAAYFGTVAVYVCEIAEPRVRGFWGSAVSINAYFGIFLINVIGAYYNIKATAVICGCFPVLHIILFSFMPESPYYLLKKGKDEESKRSLTLLRWTTNIGDELSSLKSDVQRQLSERGSFGELISINSNRRALLICILARFSKQITGGPAFTTYTEYMFQQVGGNISGKTSSIIFTGMMFLFAAISVYAVKLLRWRPLMIFSCSGSGFVLAGLAGYFYIKQFTSIDISNVNWIPLTGMLIYLAVCSPGVSILPTLIVGELFSVSVKEKAISVINLTFGLGFSIIPKVFQLLTHNLGMYAPFLFFAISSFICSILLYFCFIETKGKTLEEIQQELKGNKRATK